MCIELIFIYELAEKCFAGLLLYINRIYTEDLPHRAKTVYMYLKGRSNQEGQCYPAIGTIARELQLSRRTVERAIADLIRAGLLEKEQPALHTKGTIATKPKTPPGAALPF